MPLAFPSLSHGTVAFGFFNIESDMLLLDVVERRCFFFAEDFCRGVRRLLHHAAEDPPAEVPGWEISDPRQVGDLHGAIAGQDLSGFIGATYRVHPFPAAPEDFKQNPEGLLGHAEARRLMAPFGTPTSWPLAPAEAPRGAVLLGGARFDADGFARLVAYVDRGGYPRWRDERRPAYVQRLMRAWRAGPTSPALGAK